MIADAYRTAKQGKDDADRIIRVARESSTDTLTGRMDAPAYYSRLVFAFAARFGAAGAARDCTAAYRRAFCDRVAVTA
jgi:hypothetical protein